MAAPQSDSAELLDKVVNDVRQSFLDDRAILSFRQYFDLVAENSTRHLRCAAQYVVDMMDFFGREVRQLPWGDVTRYKVFDAPFAGGEGRVVGQEAVQQQLYRIFANFAREGRVNKLVLLHGPNGSAKSSLCRALMAGLEAYAREPEGAVYSFNWIFPSERLSSADRIGFGSNVRIEDGAGTYAFLPSDSIDARVPCEMHDHPLFLLPQPHRTALVTSLLPQAEPDKADPEAASGDNTPSPTTIASEYLQFGDLCYKCRRIYDALLATYEGDANRVLEHIQVERFYLSKRYRRGMATIEPQASVDARIHQVTADRSLASLPKALQHISLYEPGGPLVAANRGLLEYSDLLKRPVEAFKYLLATVETATVAMDSFVLHLDMLYLASTNETYLDAFKEHPDFPSFKGRMELVKVPYLLRYTDEKAIYSPQITPGRVGKQVAPHVADVAALWAVLTRMRKSDPDLYPKELASVIKSLTPLEKLRLYDTGEVPERLTTREARELLHRVPELYRESVGYPNYEGRFGASAREMRTALLNARHHPDYTCLSPLAVFAEIRAILGSTSVYEFLRQEVNDGYHDHSAFLEQTEALYVTWIDEEIREAMGLAPESSYTDLFGRYIHHISHWVKGEKLQDPSSGQYIDADEKFMGDIEKVLISHGETKEDFRRAVIGTIGARSLEHPELSPDYEKIFHTYINRLREDFYSSRRKLLRKINENFLKYTSGDQKNLDPKEIEQVEGMLETLRGRYGYALEAARETVAYLLKRRYAEE